MKKLNIAILALSGIVFLNSCGAAKTAGTEKKTETAAVAVEPVKEEVKEEGCFNYSFKICKILFQK